MLNFTDWLTIITFFWNKILCGVFFFFFSGQLLQLPMQQRIKFTSEKFVPEEIVLKRPSWWSSSTLGTRASIFLSSRASTGKGARTASCTYEPRGDRNELQRQRLGLHQVISHSLKPQADRLLRLPTCSMPLRKWVARGYSGLAQTIRRVAGARGLSPAYRWAVQPCLQHWPRWLAHVPRHAEHQNIWRKIFIYNSNMGNSTSIIPNLQNVSFKLAENF